MRASVIVFPGSNCDRDAKVAIERITGKAPAMVWHGDASVPNQQRGAIVPALAVEQPLGQNGTGIAGGIGVSRRIHR